MKEATSVTSALAVLWQTIGFASDEPLLLEPV